MTFNACYKQEWLPLAKVNCKCIYFAHISSMYSHFQANPDTLPVFEVRYLTVTHLTMLCENLLAMQTELCHLKVTVRFIVHLTTLSVSEVSKGLQHRNV